MTCRIVIENPPPFRQAPRGTVGQLVDVSIEGGAKTAEVYLHRNPPITGFHHSDLDPYEAKQIKGGRHLHRFSSFEYAKIARKKLDSFGGILIPHKVVVYQPAQSQEMAFRQLVESGIRDVVLVEKPYSVHPHGISYHTSVTEMLMFLRNRCSDFSLNFGAIDIHSRNWEAERIADKFVAAGEQLQVMGQFLDEVDSFVLFLDRLADVFSKRNFNIGDLKWNLGLAMYALRNRTFYKKLLRKDDLACENRFQKLATSENRIRESIQMNLEFAEKAKEKANLLNINLGFSLQPASGVLKLP